MEKIKNELKNYLILRYPKRKYLEEIIDGKLSDNQIIDALNYARQKGDRVSDFIFHDNLFTVKMESGVTFLN